MALWPKESPLGVSWEPGGALCSFFPHLSVPLDSLPRAGIAPQETVKLREKHQGPQLGAQRESSPELRGDWSMSHGLEAAGHMTMASPSHHPLLPPTGCYPVHRNCQEPQL